MKTSFENLRTETDYLKFIAKTMALLALMCLIFPRSGITVGNNTLRFPSAHQVLAGDRGNNNTPLLAQSLPPQELNGIADSIDYDRRVLFTGDARLWVPNNNEGYFDPFLAAAQSARQSKRTVRVLHYGDSQIEGDRISCQLRERLQERYGGGGIGMIPLEQPIPSLSFNQKTQGSPIGQSTYGGAKFVKADGNYGPMLRSWLIKGSASVEMSVTANRIAFERVKRFSSVKVLYNNREGSLSASMSSKQLGNTQSQHDDRSGIHTLCWQHDSLTSATLSLSGHADIYGIMVDDGYGVAVDNISMRGVSGQQFTQTNADQLSEAYRQMEVGLILLQFGGNSVPYLKDEKAVDHYCAQLGKQIDYLHRVSPGTPILFIGPSDMATKVEGRMATYPILPLTVERLRDTVLAHNAAFWSIYDAMGGSNSMVAWVEQGLACRDYVHFTHKGANLIGERLCDLMMRLEHLFLFRQKGIR